MGDCSVTDIPPPSLDGDERAMLNGFLDYLRSRVAAKLSGVDDDLARRPQVSSGTSIYWLGTHMSAIELNQFQRILDGRPDDQLVPPAPPPPDEDRMSEVLARYDTACRESRSILAGFDDLGTLSNGVDRRTGERRTVRWVMTHMIEETARHLGHLDILREQADESTGR